jgi:AIR carboxylase
MSTAISATARTTGNARSKWTGRCGAPNPARRRYADAFEAHLQGLDSLLSTVQMPKGIPVATFAIGLQKKLTEFRRKQTEAVLQAAPLRF